MFRARNFDTGSKSSLSEPHTNVALKLLRPHPCANEMMRSRRRLQREAEILQALSHPNIQRVYGYQEADGEAYLVSELIGGPCLADLMNGVALSEAEVLEVARELAGALAFAHSQGVCHCDVSPSNLRYGADGHLKLLDFGLARRHELI